MKAESITGMYVVTQLGLDLILGLGPRPSLFLSFSGLSLVRGLWTMFCRLSILLKPKRLMGLGLGLGLGLSVINKLFRSLGFHQTQLETYKSIIYDSYPRTLPSHTCTLRTDSFLLLYHVYRPTKRGFYSSLDNLKLK